MLLVPALGTLSAIASGELIACGRSGSAISTAALRTVPAICVVVLLPGVPIAGIAGAFVVGELIRLMVLRRLVSEGPETARSAYELNARGLPHQSVAMLASQVGPVTDRSFLSGVPGAISAYEMADKLFFAIVQAVSTGLLTRRVGSWARLRGGGATAGKRVIYQDLKVLIGASIACATMFEVLVLFFGRVLDVPDVWRTALTWSAILIAALPFNIGIMSLGRLLVLAGRQGQLLGMGLLTAGGNALLDWMLFLWLGPEGVPVATVCVRIVSCAVYIVLVRRVLDEFLGHDAADVSGSTR
jgi:Na+-driven multidrug efflux pump